MTSVPPPRDPAAPRAIPPQQRRTGLVALAAVFLALFLIVGGIRGAVARPEAAATPQPTGYLADPSIPPDARTKVYSSGQAASGQFALNTTKGRAATRAEKINPFRVQVETSLHTDPDAVAAFIRDTLDDPRGWASYGKNSFDLVNGDAPGALTFVLASPKTVDSLCGADKTKGLWDCRVGNQLVLNSDRWFYMTPTFDALPEYRAFMVNRLIGFWLGQQTTQCRHQGAYAPVMVDQGKELGGCLPNAWPVLAGEKPGSASATPGAKAPATPRTTASVKPSPAPTAAPSGRG